MKLKNIILILSLTAILFVSSSVAYFSDFDRITNHIHGYSEKSTPVEYLEIKTDEDFQPPVENDNKPFTKDVKIKNTGNISCFVRVRLEFSSSETENISYLSYSDDIFIPAPEFKNSPPENWVYSDGFYYYTEILSPNDSTTSLIKQVKTVDNAKDFHIFVYSEAVSADNYYFYKDAWA